MDIHHKAVKHIIHYIKGISTYKLTVGGLSDGLYGFSDSDWASQPDHHSISGYTFFFHGGLIS